MTSKPDSAAIQAAKEYHHRRNAQMREQREAHRQEWPRRVQIAISALAPNFPAITQLYLFGSIVQPGRFRVDSDIDVAVESRSVEMESEFWQALEQSLQRNIDMRPLAGPIAQAVEAYGAKVYERESPAAHE